jgi:hypothetical protein
VHINIYFLSAVAGVLVVIWEALKTAGRGQKRSISDMVRHAVEDSVVPLATRMTVLETKFDMVLSGITFNSVSVLHHPEPSRARVDYLLDCYREKTITVDELEELRGYLEIIMRWEEGKEAPFKIFQGEQAAAAMMLSTMDHVVAPEEP